MANEEKMGPHGEGRSAAVQATGTSHETLAHAQQGLYRALGRPQPGREREWADGVAHELHRLRKALLSHEDQIQGPGGLYDELRHEAPWLLGRVSQLVSQMARIQAETADLSVEVERVRTGDLASTHNIRADAERLLTMLRDLTSKEVDLVYERFNEPVALD